MHVGTKSMKDKVIVYIITKLSLKNLSNGPHDHWIVSYSIMGKFPSCSTIEAHRTLFFSTNNCFQNPVHYLKCKVICSIFTVYIVTVN